MVDRVISTILVSLSLSRAAHPCIALKNGKSHLFGDIEFDSCQGFASEILPVPPHPPLCATRCQVISYSVLKMERATPSMHRRISSSATSMLGCFTTTERIDRRNRRLTKEEIQPFVWLNLDSMTMIWERMVDTNGRSLNAVGSGSCVRPSPDNRQWRRTSLSPCPVR